MTLAVNGAYGADSVYTFAPRLALAMDQRRNEILTARHNLNRLTREMQGLERLLVHRDLQLIRAGSTGDGRYVKRRQDKLDMAKRHARQVRAEIAECARILVEAGLAPVTAADFTAADDILDACF
jgi:hypothetical protein